MEQIQVPANHRELDGTSGAKRVRNTGAIPAIVYGHGHKPVAISVSQNDVVKAMRTKAGRNAIITLHIEGAKKPEERTVIVKDIQYDAVHGRMLHIDFHQISLKERIKVKVPVVVQGESLGVKHDGGMLEHFLRELEVECLPTEVPASIVVDIAALKIGDAVHVKDLAAPGNATIVTDQAMVILSVLPPHVEKAPELAAVEAPSEPELIRKKKEEEGEEAEAEGDKDEAKAEKTEPKKAGK